MLDSHFLQYGKATFLFETLLVVTFSVERSFPTRAPYLFFLHSVRLPRRGPSLLRLARQLSCLEALSASSFFSRGGFQLEPLFSPTRCADFCAKINRTASGKAVLLHRGLVSDLFFCQGGFSESSPLSFLFTRCAVFSSRIIVLRLARQLSCFEALSASCSHIKGSSKFEPLPPFPSTRWVVFLSRPIRLLLLRQLHISRRLLTVFSCFIPFHTKGSFPNQAVSLLFSCKMGSFLVETHHSFSNNAVFLYRAFVRALLGHNKGSVPN